jgi:hypothetical protein
MEIGIAANRQVGTVSTFECQDTFLFINNQAILTSLFSPFIIWYSFKINKFSILVQL